MNKVTLLGNITRDVELNYAQSGKAWGKTSIAVNNRRKKDDVLFIDIIFFDKLAEIANTYLKKGDKICIAGRLDLNDYTDSTGKRQMRHSVIVEDLEMLQTQNKQKQDVEPFPTPKFEPYTPPRIEIDEEEIPF